MGDAPIIFFTRRIGLSEGQPVRILGGGRVTGRAGPYTIGVLSIETDEDSDLGVDKTNFSVFRVKRNVLSRSSIGMIATHRSRTLDGTGSNQAFGVDGAFAVLSNLFIDTYYARTKTARTEAGAEQDPPTGECCVGAPPIMVYDSAGNLVASWGGPADGYDWPQSNHGITLDHKDNIWIGGNGRDDAHVLKFTRDGTFIAQFGKPGVHEATPPGRPGGRPGMSGDSHSTENFGRCRQGVDRRRGQRGVHL